ncbi:hypothetical protein SAMN04488029_2416 [Reichenbachiella faecimaris]|uniref:MetA-pathway of phenol degradation n=1 Tax=Reichenbachiella faecimaris TaxID=692418 RepID=A0A1W2GF22_REIFA|nr:hypothetical protein [Reichenbachiella faecimaris]SMD35247.1 hypothetical protein SAMN04488029_2416 [Reichenbachiella faecimaris]
MVKINMTNKLLVVSLFLIFFAHNVNAQETIATARPTLSIGPWVLPEHSFQWEQGAQYSDIEGEEWGYDAFFRAALSRSMEIRILIPTLESRAAVFGVKWMMLQPEGNKPGVGVSMNLANQNGELKVVGYRVAVNKKLTDNLIGFVNAGYASGGYFGDVTLAYALADKITITGEYWHHEDWKQLHASFIYLINSETQIDLNGGYLIDAGNDYTFGLGFSRRFKYNGPRNDG